MPACSTVGPIGVSSQESEGNTPVGAFSVEVDRRNGGCRVGVTGEIDIATIDSLKAALLRCPTGDVILDLRDVTFIDTSALRLFVEQQRAAEERGTRFAIARPHPNVRRLLDIAGFADRVEITDDAEPGDAEASG